MRAMTKLIPIQVDANTVIYMETTANVELPPGPQSAPPASSELTREDLGLGDKGAIEDATRKAMQSFAVMENTIKTYTKRTLNAFKDAALADVSKVQLEFGINMSGEAGIPYVTKGTAECSLKITVECSFTSPKSDKEDG